MAGYGAFSSPSGERNGCLAFRICLPQIRVRICYPCETLTRALPSSFYLYSPLITRPQLSTTCKPHIILLLFLSCGGITLFASDTPTPWAASHFTIDPKVLYGQASDATTSEGTNVAVLDDEESYNFDESGR